MMPRVLELFLAYIIKNGELREESSTVVEGGEASKFSLLRSIDSPSRVWKGFRVVPSVL